MQKKFIKKAYKGQTLVELAITIMVATITLVGLVSLAISGLKTAQEAQRKTTATKLANLGIEMVTLCRNAFYNSLETSCSFPTSGSLFVTNNGIGGNLIQAVPNGGSIDSQGFVTILTTDSNLLYKRRIKIEKLSQDSFLVISTIRWDITTTNIGEVKFSRLLTVWK